jgi:hypothetical protein
VTTTRRAASQTNRSASDIPSSPPSQEQQTSPPSVPFDNSGGIRMPSDLDSFLHDIVTPSGGSGGQDHSRRAAAHTPF